MKLIFPNSQEINYVVSSMKYCEYSGDKDIVENKMYPLLPLQVFKLRYKMEQIKKKCGEKSVEIRETILEAKSIAEKTAKEGSRKRKGRRCYKLFKVGSE